MNVESRVSKGLWLYTQMCIVFNSSMDWHYVRSQCSTNKEADQYCADCASILNLTIERDGKEYTPNLGG